MAARRIAVRCACHRLHLRLPAHYTCARALADHSCDYDLDRFDGCTSDCGSCDESGNTGGCDYSCDMACTGLDTGCSASCDGDHAYEIYRRCDDPFNCPNNSPSSAATHNWKKYQPAAATACANYGACRPRAPRRSPLASPAARVAQA